MRLGQWPTLDIQFPFAEPRHIEQYQVNFPCEYRFITTMGHQPLQLKIAKHLLHAPFPEHSVYLARFYRQQLAISSSHSSNIQQVGLVQCILQHFKKHKQLTLEQLASLLCMSRATLKRKLTLHHTSYQQLWDLHRQQVAVFELAEQQKCNEDVAQTLQFSDITNFRRSVKRWTGMTPDDIRRKFAEKLNIEDQHAL